MQKILEYLGVRDRPIAGLELSSSAVKLMLLVKKDAKYKLTDFYFELLPPGKIKEKKIVDTEYVNAVLLRAFNKIKHKTDKVCICLANAIAISKTIVMPNDLNDEDIGNEIAMDAEKYISFPIEDVNIDYQILQPSANKEGFNDVIVYVCKTDDINALVSLVESIGFNVSIVDIDSIALQRGFSEVLKQLPDNGDSQTVALFDIGSDVISLTVFSDKKVVYYREQNFGGNLLINEIQTRYGLSFEEAVVSTKVNDLPGDYIKDILEPFKENVFHQIQRNIKFYLSANNNVTIDFVFLTGGVATIPGLEETIQTNLEIKTFIANPFINFSYENLAVEELIMQNAATLMTCCGLAMRNVI